MKQTLGSTWLMLLMVAALTLVTGACEIFGADEDLRVTISPRQLNIGVGDTALVSYTVSNPRGGSTYARLESKAPTIAGVREPDRVFGISSGTAWIVVAAWADAGLTGRDSIRVHVE